jgi:hypothetical protein
MHKTPILFYNPEPHQAIYFVGLSLKDECKGAFPVSFSVCSGVMFYLFFHIAYDKLHITRHTPLDAPFSQPHCSVQTGFTVARILLRLPNQR